VSGSRIAAARARAASAKAVILVSAVLVFCVALVLAAWTRPGSASGKGRSVVTSNVASDSDFSDSFFGETDDSSSGVIAPTQSTPQVATGSS
jgi:hypothetical protein